MLDEQNENREHKKNHVYYRVCKNCKQPTSISQNYCPKCRQAMPHSAVTKAANLPFDYIAAPLLYKTAHDVGNLKIDCFTCANKRLQCEHAGDYLHSHQKDENCKNCPCQKCCIAVLSTAKKCVADVEHVVKTVA